MSASAQGQQVPAPTIISVGPGSGDTDLDIVWSWSRGTSSCAVGRYMVQYKRTDVADWSGDPFVNNDANGGTYEIHEDLGAGVANKRFTINAQSQGLISNPGEIGVVLDDAPYDARVLVYSLACDEYGGPIGDGLSGRPLYLLDKPTSFSATAGDAQVTLAATVVQRGPALQKWQYAYKTGGGAYGAWFDIANSASTSMSGKEVPGLVNGTTYTFKVRGVHEQGEGVESDEATVTLTADTTPSFGTETVPDQNYTQDTAIATLTLPVASGGNGTLTYALSPTAPAGLTFDAANRTLTGIPTAPQTSAEYTYTATDDDGDAAELNFDIRVSANLVLTGLADGVVDEHSDFTDTATLANAVGAVTWTLGGDDADEFALSDTGATAATVTLASPDYENPTDADADNVYHYTLTATDTDGNTVTSDTVDVTVNDVVDMPAKPTGFHATPGDGQVTLSWTDPGDATITKYQVRYKAGTNFPDDDATMWDDIAGSGATTTSHVVTGLAAGMEHVFQVRAVNSAGAGDPSDAATATIMDGICGRTAAVRDAIVAALGTGVTCAGVTASQLAGIDDLSLRNASLSSLQSDDFAGLVGLGRLDLRDNHLTALPSDVFAGLIALETLNLRDNNLGSLPTGVFSGLGDLQTLNLRDNNLSVLPSGVFSGLSSLTTLNLRNNNLGSLPAGVFAGLTGLATLNLNDNVNGGVPLPVTLERVSDGEFRAVASAGAPFGLTLPVTVSGAGQLGSGVTSVSIPAGSTHSAVVAVTRVTGTTAAVTADLGTLPGLPSGHQGYTLTKSADLPVEVLAASLSTVSIAVVSAQVAEGTAAQFTLTRTEPTVAALDVSVQVTETGSVLATPSGYTSAVTVTIPSGTATATLTVATDDDTVDEELTGAPGVAGRITATVQAGSSYTLPATAAATVEVTDDDAPTWTVSASPATMLESGGTSTVTVDTGGVTFADDRTITLALSGTATVVTDYTISSAGAVLSSPYAVTLTAGSSSVAATLTGVSDTVSDTGETVTVTASLSGTTLGAATATIMDGICGRTAAVRDAIVAALGTGVTCAGVTASQLAGIDDLSLRNASLSSLQSDDFAGLVGLGRLDLRDNHLTALPSDVFAGLIALETLNLRDNNLGSLPTGVFSGLGDLQTLNLRDNNLSVLPSGVFSGLSSLTTLNLRNNNLGSLPAGVFAGLTGLATLNLNDNVNGGVPLPVTLERVSDGEFRAVASAGAPFGLTLPVTVSGAGQLGSGVTSVSIPAGSTHSAVVAVTRVTGTTAAVTADLGTLPGLPSGHQGYTLTKSADLPVEVLAASLSTVSIAVVSAQVAEGTAAQFTLTRTEPTVAALDVSVQVTETGSVLATPSGYTSAVTVTIPSGTATATLTVATDDDTVDEELTGAPGVAGRITATVQAGSSYTLPATAAATVEVTDDDAPTWTVSASPATMLESGGTSTVTVDTGGVTFADDRTITLALSGTATVVTDYTISSAGAVLSSPYAVTLTAGSSSVAATLTGVSDTVSDTGETVTVTASLSGTTLGAATATITDGICGRTAAVRDAIVAALGTGVTCAGVTASQLAGIDDLSLRNTSLSSLQSDDFAGLVGLERLDLRDNHLTALPSDVFSGLIALETLNLRNGGLGSLPTGVFSGLGDLQTLNLRDNNLSVLPSGVFSGLSSLTTLNLRNNNLGSLPAGVFAGLTGLTTLNLNDNVNGGVPLPVTLERVSDGEFRAVASAGAPFGLTLPVTVSGAGQLGSGVTSVSIPAGSTHSAVVAVTRVTGTTAAVTADLGTLPGLPSGHQGYTLTKSADLPVEVMATPASVSLSVADASAQEGSGVTVDFVVTLSGASTSAVTVDYATSDGTALSGQDYTAATGTLTFAAGETSKTVSVAVIDDAVDEGDETFTLTLSGASGATISTAAATGTISNADPLPQAWLTRFGRAVAGHVVDGVGERLLRTQSPTPHVRFAGVRMDLGGGDGRQARVGTLPPHGLPASAGVSLGTAWGPSWTGGGPGGTGAFTGQTPTGGTFPTHALSSTALSIGATPPSGAYGTRPTHYGDLLLNSSFAFASGGEEDTAPAWTFWGQGAGTRFDGGGDEVRVDGDVRTYLMGADTQRGRWLAGAALSLSEGAGGYEANPHTDANGPERGALTSSLTGIHPYARYAINERLSAWGTAGYATGETTLNREDAGHWTVDTSLRMAAAGLRGVLRQAGPDGGVELAVRADAMWTAVESEGVTTQAGRLAGSQGATSRLRLILEGSRAFALAGGRALTPSLELGLRRDGGDAETGAGLELGGGVRFADPGLGLAVELNARGLVSHSDAQYREWGAGASVRFDPGVAGKGLRLELAPSWGTTQSGGAERLWSQTGVADLFGSGRQGVAGTGRMDAELGYAMDGPRGKGLQTPFAALSRTDGGDRALRLGWRLAPGPLNRVDVEAVLRQPAIGGPPDAGVRASASLRW